MKVTPYGSLVIAAVVFALLTLFGIVGTAMSITMLVETNQLIHLLTALGAAYGTILFFQCILHFMNKL